MLDHMTFRVTDLAATLRSCLRSDGHEPPASRSQHPRQFQQENIN